MLVALPAPLKQLGFAAALLVVGCDDAKPPAADTAGSAAVDLKDDRDSATFRTKAMPEILMENYEARTEEFVEARKWLADAKHVTGKLPRPTAEALVEKLYAAGALKVFMTDFTTEGDVVTAESLVALVTAVPSEARDKVIAVRNDHYKTYLPTVGKGDLVAELTKIDAVPAVVLIGLKY